MWMQGNRPLLGQVPASVQITQWGSPVAQLVQAAFRRGSLAPASASGVAGIVPTDHPYYNDPAYWRTAWGISTLVGMALGGFIGGYHGRKRSGGKLGSTLGYGVAGALFPLPTLAVAGFQGFSKRKGR